MIHWNGLIALLIGLTTPFEAYANSEGCRAFLNYSLRNKGSKPSSFNTDQMVILKNGQVVFEYYNGDPNYGGNPKTGFYTKDSPHCLWSASKTVSDTVAAAVIHGGHLSLNDPLAKFITRDSADGRYDAIRIEDLIEMSSNIAWNEIYDADIRQSSFLPMLYLPAGNQNMVTYAKNQPLGKYSPGQIWNYSGGNTVLLMGVLKSLFPDLYDHLPWRLLFDKLGMRNTVFERDGQGIFIGNSYIHMRPIDMASLGQLYLDKGFVGGEQIIGEDWIEQSQIISPAVLRSETPIAEIKSEGVYSSRGFWLNQQAQGYGPEFKGSPPRMYFMAGHYGQMIIILPDEKMIIARTGDDPEYWSKINPFVSRAVECFADSGQAQPWVSPGPSPSLKGDEQVYSIYSSLLGNILSKELCSCVFVTGLYDRMEKEELNDVTQASYGSPGALSLKWARDRAGERAKNLCLKRESVPISGWKLGSLLTLKVTSSGLTAKPTWLAQIIAKTAGKGIHLPLYEATYDRQNPQYGCSLKFH